MYSNNRNEHGKRKLYQGSYWRMAHDLINFHKLSRLKLVSVKLANLKDWKEADEKQRPSSWFYLGMDWPTCGWEMPFDLLPTSRSLCDSETPPTLWDHQLTSSPSPTSREALATYIHYSHLRRLVRHIRVDNEVKYLLLVSHGNSLLPNVHVLSLKTW